jgi:hypothetical protein
MQRDRQFHRHMVPDSRSARPAGGNGVTTTIAGMMETSPELSVVGLRALGNKALARGSDTIQTSQRL